MHKSKTGVLLLNIGTPSQPTTKSVRCFLREFLDDPRVMDVPSIQRKLLLYGIILPFRSSKSAKAYQAIWDNQLGSPLLHHGRNLTLALQTQLGDDYVVRLGMRYGKPSIEVASQPLLSECDKIVVVPLFPHYASSSTGSVIEKTLKVLSYQENIPAIEVIKPFYQHPAYIEALTASMSESLNAFSPCHLVLSYHGLPMRQLRKSEPKAQPCDQNKPCPSINCDNQFCYRAQCYTTSKLLANSLHFSEGKITTAFQSRLGRGEWIGPDLNTTLKQLKEQGAKRLAIAMPSFVTDCLETLEEIGIRAKQSWLKMGGEDFLMLPCLNDGKGWVKGLEEIILRGFQ